MSKVILFRNKKINNQVSYTKLIKRSVIWAILLDRMLRQEVVFQD